MTCCVEEVYKLFQGPLHTNSDKVQSAALPTSYSIGFSTVLHPSAELCCCLLFITIEVYIVGAIQENPLVISQATLQSLLHAVRHWCVRENEIVRFKSAPQ